MPSPRPAIFDKIDRLLTEDPTKLDLSGERDCDDDAVLYLCAKAGQLTQLQWLYLSSTRVTDKSLEKLADAALAGQLTQLQGLYLNSTRVTDESMEKLADAAGAGQLTQLQRLDLSFTQVTDKSMEKLADAAKAGQLTQLQGLYLNSTRVTDESMEKLADAAGAGQLTQLQRLGLDSTQVTDKSMEKLADAAGAGQLTQLQRLYLSSTRVTDESMEKLADAAGAGQLTQLQELGLDSTQVTDESMEKLADAAGAGQLTQLQRLGLDSTQVTDKSMEKLADAAGAGQLTQLQRLYLSSTRVTDESMEKLADAAGAGQLTQLQRLDLDSTQVTDKSMEKLADAAGAGQLTQLQWLDLSSTQVTDKSMEKLADAAGAGQLTQLQWLDLSGCPILSLPDTPEARIGSLEKILGFWREAQDPDSELLLEAKVVVLGEGEAGKSELCRRLRGEPPLRKYIRTPDFEVHTMSVPVRAYDERQERERDFNIKLNVFDCGGQKELYSTHRLVLTHHRNVYVIVVSACRTARDNHLDYWLSVAAHHGRSTERGASASAPVSVSPVVVVITHCDSPLRKLEAPAVKAAVASVRAAGVPVDLVEDYDSWRESADCAEPVRQKLSQAVKQLKEIFTARVGPVMLRFRDEIQKQFQPETGSDAEFAPMTLTATYVHGEMMDECIGNSPAPSDKDRRRWVGLGRDLGWYWYQSPQPGKPVPLLSKYIFNLDRCRGPIYSLYGADPIQRFADTWPNHEELVACLRESDPDLTEDEAHLLIDLMVDQKLAFPVTEEDESGGVVTQYVIPDKLGRSRRQRGPGERDQPAPRSATHRQVAFKPYLPDSVLLDFVVDAHQAGLLKGLKHFVFRDEATIEVDGCRAELTANRDGARVDVVIRGPSKVHREKVWGTIEGLLRIQNTYRAGECVQVDDQADGDPRIAMPPENPVLKPTTKHAPKRRKTALYRPWTARERQVWELHHRDKMSVTQIAKALQITHPSVSQSLAAANRKMATNPNGVTGRSVRTQKMSEDKRGQPNPRLPRNEADAD